jgi:nitrate/nitrite transporter NarK
VSLLLITNTVGILLRPIVGHIADRYLGPIGTFILSLFVLASSRPLSYFIGT